MKVYSVLCLLLMFGARAQTLEQCRQRFDTYLNFRGGLDQTVRFGADAFYLLREGKREWAVYSEELPVLSAFFQHSSRPQQERLMALKGLARLSSAQLDSLKRLIPPQVPAPVPHPDKPLLGRRIAIDPGHFSTNLSDALIEQKFLLFVPDTTRRGDTVKIFESLLTFHTAHILKNMLEEKGADVFLTRTQANFTSFNCTYQDWIVYHKKRTLDSLKAAGRLSPEQHRKLMTCNPNILFREFFRDHDLSNRAAKINAFAPDLSLIIHYNVDEKNEPWKSYTEKNYAMTFIGGAFTAASLRKTDSRIDFLRLLLSDQLNRSEALSARTVFNFNKTLEIPIARAVDAAYLKEHSMITASPGVFCRNLALCRKVNSPVVYGESMYQDNERESRLLMRSDMDIYGIQTSERVTKVAFCYYEAVHHILTGGHH
jgi:N-acetylmuramoyl-L-alanine amidase